MNIYLKIKALSRAAVELGVGSQNSLECVHVHGSKENNGLLRDVETFWTPTIQGSQKKKKKGMNKFRKAVKRIWQE